MSKRYTPTISASKKLVDLDHYEHQVEMVQSTVGEYVLYEAHKNTVDQFNKTKNKNALLTQLNKELKAEIERLKLQLNVQV